MASLHPVETREHSARGWAAMSTREAVMAGAIGAGLIGLAISGVGAREWPIFAALLGGVIGGLSKALFSRHD